MLKINGKYVCPVLKVGNDSDFHATIYVTADVGTSITVDGKTKVVEDEGVMVDFPIYKINTYTITATLDGHTQTQTQSVSSATEYYKTFYMKTELNIYSEVGSVVTLNGVSKTVTEAYVTFDIYETGSYTVSVIKDGVTKQSTISVSNMTQTYEEYVYFTATIIANGAVGVEVTLNGETKTITDDDGVAFLIDGRRLPYKGKNETGETIAPGSRQLHTPDILDALLYVAQQNDMSFVNNEDATALTTAPTATCSYTSTSNAGTYDIVPTGAAASGILFLLFFFLPE